MPVVTMTTFHEGVSGVASRSRLTTPTLRGALRIVSAMLRMASVFPVPVPATMPKPLPDAASRRMSSPCSRSGSVSDVSPSANSMVSQTARVGAMTMTRPVVGSAARNALGSGGRKWSREMRTTEYRNTLPLPALRERGREEGETLCGLPVPVIVAVVVAVPPDYDHTTCRVVAPRDHNHGCRTIPAVMRTRVAVVIRPADHDLSGEVRISKTQRNADAGLRGSDGTGESKQ